MGIAVLLVIGIAGLLGIMFLPTIFDMASSTLLGISPTIPLSAIVDILPYAFGGLIIIGIFWALVRGTGS